MRARYPDSEGFVERDGVRTFYEVYGDGDPTILLLPGWTLPARSFKAQIPYLARHFRVVAVDPRGAGKSDKPMGVGSYAIGEHVADTLAVMDATDSKRAVVLGKSRHAQTALLLAGEHPDRVTGLIAIGAFIPLSAWPPVETVWKTIDEPRRWRRRLTAARSIRKGASELRGSPTLRLVARRIGPLEGATMFARQQMVGDYEGFARWFVGQIAVTDPHATKQAEDAIAWMLEGTGDVAADSFAADCLRDPAPARAAAERVKCPVLVVHGDRDLTCPVEWGRALAQITGGELFEVAGAGHLTGARYPVAVNLALRRFIESLPSEGSDGHPRAGSRQAAVLPTQGAQ
ncbi:MAG: alpha/beta hydrolase [Actinomycetota bacterium]|nr:alpha/beta hydrolase [Actinomycetota bacterium]